MSGFASGFAWRRRPYAKPSGYALRRSFLFAARPCEKHETDFILEAFSVRDERLIPASLAREWYIVLAMDETKSKHKQDKALENASESEHSSQPKGVFARIKAPFSAAFPVMIGYVFLGIPCGILAQQIGLDPLQVFLLSMLFYSGAGQYMIPNMWLAGSPALAIIASVTLVNTRQLLYGASLSRFCHQTPKPLSFLFGATVTDESFAVNLGRFSSGEWKGVASDSRQSPVRNNMGPCQHSWCCSWISSYGAYGIGVVRHDQHLSVPFVFPESHEVQYCCRFDRGVGCVCVQVRRFVGPGYPCWCPGRRCCRHDRFQEGGHPCRGVSLPLLALPARLPS